MYKPVGIDVSSSYSSSREDIDLRCNRLLTKVILNEDMIRMEMYSTGKLMVMTMERRLLLKNFEGYFKDDTRYMFQDKKITLLIKSESIIAEVEIEDLFEKIYKHSEQLVIEAVFLNENFSRSNITVCHFDITLDQSTKPIYTSAVLKCVMLMYPNIVSPEEYRLAFERIKFYQCSIHNIRWKEIINNKQK